MNYYRCRYFKIEELVSAQTHATLGDSAWRLFDDRILRAADTVRLIVGSPMIINDWSWGGSVQQRGFRNAVDSTVGAIWSQHKYGRAFDMVCPKMDAESVRKRCMISNELKKYISCIEKDVAWLHIDCRNLPFDNGDILLVNG